MIHFSHAILHTVHFSHVHFDTWLIFHVIFYIWYIFLIWFFFTLFFFFNKRFIQFFVWLFLLTHDYFPLWFHTHNLFSSFIFANKSVFLMWFFFYTQFLFIWFSQFVPGRIIFPMITHCTHDVTYAFLSSCALSQYFLSFIPKITCLYQMWNAQYVYALGLPVLRFFLALLFFLPNSDPDKAISSRRFRRSQKK